MTDPPAGTRRIRHDAGLEQVEHPLTGICPCDELAHDRIIGPAEPFGQRHELNGRPPTGAPADGRPLARQHGPQHRPPATPVTDESGLWDEDLGEEDLVEVIPTRHLAQWAHLDARSVHVEHEARQPGRVRTSARCAPGGARSQRFARLTSTPSDLSRANRPRPRSPGCRDWPGPNRPRVRTATGTSVSSPRSTNGRCWARCSCDPCSKRTGGTISRATASIFVDTP